jgi:hypothetical protein
VATTTRSPILDRAIEAYGGEERWRGIETIKTNASCKGLLATWKRGHGFDNLEIEARAWEPWIRLAPLDDGSTGILDRHDVTLERNGQVVGTRKSARDRFPYGRQLFRWDEMDMVYFIGYAFWNYIVMPTLFIRDDIQWTEKSPTKLEAVFPAEIPTHSNKQRFHFDPDTGLVSQYDYTSKIFGSWAKASHIIEHATSEDGLVYTSHRLIRPTIAGKPGPKPFPLLFDVRMKNYRAV